MFHPKHNNWLRILVHIFSYSADRFLAQDLWDVTDLRSVTSFSPEQIVEHYISFNELKSPINPKNEDTKKMICKEIFDSHYFRINEEGWDYVDPQDIFTKLRNDFPATFQRLFIRKSSNSDIYKYKNSYKKLTINIIAETAITFEEQAFVCLVRNRDTDNIREFFVTQEYNMNLVKDAPPIAARFIISHAAAGNALFMEAMAEEAAKTYEFLRRIYSLEGFYMMVRRRYIPTPMTQMDPVCSLSEANKLRLCASLFAAHEFNHAVKFTPSIENVELECEKKEVLTTSWSGRLVRRFFEDRIYGEWMMGCTALNSNDEEITYFVSRGTCVNSIFVYRLERADELNRVSVYSMAINVSVVDDKWTAFDIEDWLLVPDVED